MKLLSGLIYLLLGGFQFSSVPSDRSFVSARSTDQDTTKKTVFIPEKINLASFLVLTVTDTAYKPQDIGQLLNKDYGEIFKYCDRHKLKTGKMMAFYYSSHLPFVLDAAVEVDRLPDRLTGGIKARKIKGGDAIVVHYKGPYDQIGVAYAAIAIWLKENNKRALQQPFEIYLNDPGTIKDPQLLLTDVYQRIQ